MWIVIPRFRDLDGWDALGFLVTLFLGLTLASVVGLHGGELVIGAFVFALLPMGFRRALWPRVEGHPADVSGHSVGTLLLMGVGALVLVLGALASVVFASAVSDASSKVPVAVMVLPIGTLALGAGLVALGWRLSRRPR